MRERLAVFLLLTLAVLVIPGASGLAWAHSPFEAGADAGLDTGGASDARVRPGELPGWALAAAPELPGVPWSALAMAATAIALGWRRPRRAAAFALVLILAVFAFEDGLHSVHHSPEQAQ